MPRTSTALRLEIEAALVQRIPAALTQRHREIQKSVQCGIGSLDDLQAFPRGTLVEICGLPSSGRTSLCHTLLAQTTSLGEAVALIDVNDNFDPVTASCNGVALAQLLWVRCGSAFTQPNLSSLDHALRAADLLLQSGGFGLLVLDMGSVTAREAQKVPQATWFRFRRAVEETQTLFLIIEQRAHAGSSASVVLDLSQSEITTAETKEQGGQNAHVEGARLIQTLNTRAEVVRGQVRKAVHSAHSTATYSTRLQGYR